MNAPDAGTDVTGGCLCGAVRYSVRWPPLNIGYCHCRMCQRASGAPVVAWLTVARQNFQLTSGETRAHRSSSRGLRRFCPVCGTPLTMEVPGDDREIDVTVASLDTPEIAAPDHHGWTSNRVAWFDTSDRLPRYGEDYPG